MREVLFVKLLGNLVLVIEELEVFLQFVVHVFRGLLEGEGVVWHEFDQVLREYEYIAALSDPG